MKRRGAGAVRNGLLALVTVGSLLLASAPAPLAWHGSGDEQLWVDPFIGTSSGAPDFGTGGGAGATFPGAVLPFGMAQFSPDTIPSTTNFAGGYSYDDNRMRGFSLTHFSGAGCAIFQDVPILPTSAAIKGSPAVKGSSDIAARYVPTFDHRHEWASPGDYRVVLDPETNEAIDSELTATTRTADARLVFPSQRRASVLVNAGGSTVANFSAAVSVDPRRREISGSAESGRFCFQPTKYRLYFVVRFDRGFAASGTWKGETLSAGGRAAAESNPNAFNYKPIPGGPSSLRGDPSTGVQVGAYVSFDTRHRREVQMRVGLSFTSLAEARKNLDAEAAGKPFDNLRAAAERSWRTELAKVRVQGGDATARRLFYTALYHALIEPSTYSDADGSYRGMDGRVHRGGAVTQYANISGWDVYRTQTPLMAMLEPRRAEDLASSLIRDGQQSGCLPRWPYADQQTNVMVGDPSDPMIAATHAFGARGFDARVALRLMVAGASKRCRTSNGDYTEREGLSDYLQLGYVPEDDETDVIGHTIVARDRAWGSAATTLEDATADSSIAWLASSLGQRRVAQRFLVRASGWTGLFEKSSGYIRPRFRSGAWLTPFDPSSTAGFVEGNAAQYTWAVPWDPDRLFGLMGGQTVARRRLDRFFQHLNAGPSAPYAYLGNEPTLSTPWLYDWLGDPTAASDVVRRALLGLYRPTPGGMPGNDDGGTMSAWWVLAALGLYPAVPGSDVLALDAPLFERATIQLPSGRLVIDARGVGASRRYIQSARLDGGPLNSSWLRFAAISHGEHVLALRMGASARSGWAVSNGTGPPSPG